MDNPLRIERAVEDLATWLEADIEWKDVRAARKFVAAYLDNDRHKFRWEWDRKNMEPPEGYIILRQVRRTTKGERVLLQLYGEQVVWRQTVKGEGSEVLPIEQALFTFELVPFGKNTTHVYSKLRYEDAVPMQQYRDEVLKRIEMEVAAQKAPERDHESGVADKALAQVEQPIVRKNRGGRPRIPDDDWAWEQVNEHGCEPRDVYPEWLKRIKAQKRKLADPYESFEKAIRRGRGKKREETD